MVKRYLNLLLMGFIFSIGLFGGLVLITKAWTYSQPNSVNNGDPLSVTGWNNIVESLVWQKTGTNKVFYTGGNVGIGSLNPVVDLHIYDDVSHSQLKLSNGNGHSLSMTAAIGGSNVIGSSGILTVNSGPGTRLFLGAGNNIVAPSNASQNIGSVNRLWNSINSVDAYFSGSVGVGTFSPTAKLTVVRGNEDTSHWGSAPNTLVYSDDPTLLLVAPDRVTDQGPSIGFKGPSFLYSGIRGSATNSDTGEFGGNLDFYTTASSSYSTMKMRITEDGYVGIGTSTPNKKLDIVGDIRVDNGNSIGWWNRAYSAGSGEDYYAIRIAKSQASYAGNMEFYVRYGGDNSEVQAMTISSTAADTGTVTVNGYFQSSEIPANCATIGTDSDGNFVCK